MLTANQKVWHFKIMLKVSHVLYLGTDFYLHCCDFRVNLRWASLKLMIGLQDPAVLLGFWRVVLYFTCFWCSLKIKMALMYPLPDSGRKVFCSKIKSLEWEVGLWYLVVIRFLMERRLIKYPVGSTLLVLVFCQILFAWE